MHFMCLRTSCIGVLQVLVKVMVEISLCDAHAPSNYITELDNPQLVRVSIECRK